jgi:hypothetical protein
VLLHPVHAVGQDQTSLSIGVSDFDSQTLPAGDDIRRTVAVFVDEVLDEADGAGQVDWDPFLHDGLEGGEDGHGAQLVHEHVEHSRS